MVVGADYPLLNIIWTMFVFFAFVIWIWTLFAVFADLFRRDDISGWGKAGWTVFVIFLPLLGVLCYLISQGKQMADRRAQDVRASQQQIDQHIRSVSGGGGGGVAAELSQAKQLLDSGAITQDEFNQIKAKALAGDGSPTLTPAR
jgi:Short C-terminal domain/Phospholipase_D-nuclease N-terminal